MTYPAYEAALAEMVDTLGKLDCTTVSDIEAVANYLLARLPISKANRRARSTQDRKMVEAVILAYAKLVQDAGVKI